MNSSPYDNALSPDECAALTTAALSLRRAALSGGVLPLRGKHLGLVTEQQDGADAELFRRAATGLGAKVAVIRPSAARLLQAKDIRATAPWLGRLYDAIECQGLPAELVAEIRGAAGVPVFDGIGSAGHPSAALATALDADTGDGRCYLLQAMLVSAIG